MTTNLSLLSLVTFLQDDLPSGGDIGLGIVGLLIPLVILLGVYIYFAFCFQVIARKTNTENGWLAWIPIANIYLMCQIAGKPAWWLILFFIPLVNIIVSILIFMGIAEARNKPSWIGILMIVPVINILIPGYLAFSD